MKDKSSRGCNERRKAVRIGALGAAWLGLACGSEQLSLGEGQVELQPDEPACNGGVVQGSVEVRDQAELETLAGCQEIVGNLWIHAFPGVDLRPLAALRIVRGDLNIGLDGSGFDLIGSLEGLEALEQVSRLSIHYLGATDLAPLSNLKRVELDPLSPWDAGGNIDISGCPNLTDLTGLSGLEQWDELLLQGNDSLASLNGLGLPALGEPAIIANGLPALRDLSALGGLKRAGLLMVSFTGLERIAPLGLTIVRNLNLLHNDALADIDGLAALEVIGSLRLDNNDALQHLPEWPALRRLGDVQILGNASLTSIPAYATQELELTYQIGDLSGTGPGNSPDVVTRQQFVVFDVGSNPKLTRVALPTGLERGQYIGVYGNPSLTSLDLGSINELDQLSIRNNAVLGSVTLGALTAVDSLAVENNPLLPPETFADVASFTRVITGNAGEAP